MNDTFEIEEIRPNGEAVHLPAIFLIVTGSLGFLAGAAGLVISQFGAVTPADLRGMDPQIADLILSSQGGVALLLNGWSVVASLIVLAGAVSMLRLSSRAMGIAACIVAMTVPTLCCCILGIGIGIWGLVVLMRPEVAAAFAGKR